VCFPFDNFEARASLDVNGSVEHAGRCFSTRLTFLVPSGSLNNNDAR
jgi:hypothetical protein